MHFDLLNTKKGVPSMVTTPETTKPMNKQGLVASISEIPGFSKAVSTQVLEEMMRFITKGLSWVWHFSCQKTGPKRGS